MNGRSGVFKFFLFLLLGVIILLQVLSMIQADRLYEHLNTLIGRLESDDASRPARSAQKPAAKTSPALEEYPGDNGDWLVRGLDAEPATLCDFLASSSWSTRSSSIQPFLAAALTMLYSPETL